MNLPGRFLKSGSSSESDFLPNLSSDKNNHLFQLLLRLRMFISSYERAVLCVLCSFLLIQNRDFRKSSHLRISFCLCLSSLFPLFFYPPVCAYRVQYDIEKTPWPNENFRLLCKCICVCTS